MFISKSVKEVQSAIDSERLSRTDKIKFKTDEGWQDTTAGRVLIYGISGVLPTSALDKAGTKKLVVDMTKKFGNEETTRRLKELQDLGFRESTKYGLSICYSDFKFDFGIDFKELEADLIKMNKEDRLIAADKIINECTDRWFNEVDKSNPLYIMGMSGARVTAPQVRQMIVAKGLLGSMDGGMADYPIMESLAEGLNVLNYFNTCGPARRSLANNIFVVPAGGYFGRQLVTTARDLVCGEHDCGTDKGVVVNNKWARGRVLAETGELIYPDDKVEEGKSYIRSPMTCESHKGICAVCAGLDPATNDFWRIGMGLGTIGAQHVQEPTQQAGLASKHLSGSVTIKDFSGGITNVMGDVMKFFGGRGTMFVGPGDSTVSTITEIFEQNGIYEDFASKSLDYIMNIISEGRLNIAPVHIELIIRGCTDIVVKGDDSLGLRSSGDYGDIKCVTVQNSGTNYPSWLKRLGFGYVKSSIESAVLNYETSKGGLTEQIMSGTMRHYDN